MYIENKSIFTSYYIMNIFHIIKYFSKHNLMGMHGVLYYGYTMIYCMPLMP